MKLSRCLGVSLYSLTVMFPSVVSRRTSVALSVSMLVFFCWLPVQAMMQQAATVNNKITFFIRIHVGLQKYKNISELERITDGEMYSHTVLEPGDVVIAALARIVWNVERDSPVKTKYNEIHVVSYSDTRS